MTDRRCPYCAETIEPAAIVCRHCTRDLFFVKPLMDRIDALSERVGTLETAFGDFATSHSSPAKEPAHSQPTEAVVATRAIGQGATRWSMPIVLVIVLVALHAVLIVLLDTRLVYLRLLSIVLPLGAGFFFRRGASASLWTDTLIGLLAAGCAIAGMLWTVAHVDGVPVLPQGRLEWSETLQYALSIALGFTSGALLRRVASLAVQPDGGGVVSQLARAIAKEILGDVENASFEKRLKRIESLTTSGVAIGAAILSAIFGLGRLLN